MVSYLIKLFSKKIIIYGIMYTKEKIVNNINVIEKIFSYNN